MPAKPKVPGLIKGLGVTMGTMFRTVTQGANTVQYPHAKETPPIRARGVIALHEGIAVGAASHYVAIAFFAVPRAA